MNMKTQKSSLRTVLNEVEKTSNLVSVWLLFKNGAFAGRITSRTARNDVLHVTFSLYATERKQRGIFGYRCMTGAGYPKIDEAVTDILRENSERLREEYHINLRISGLPDAWKQDFEGCGYSLMDAL